jgi:hypothetical protein
MLLQPMLLQPTMAADREELVRHQEDGEAGLPPDMRILSFLDLLHHREAREDAGPARVEGQVREHLGDFIGRSSARTPSAKSAAG